MAFLWRNKGIITFSLASAGAAVAGGYYLYKNVKEKLQPENLLKEMTQGFAEEQL